MKQTAQMRRRRLMFSVLVLTSLLFATRASAATVSTVDWAVDPIVDGTGTGTLSPGAIVVTYFTNLGGGSSAFTFPNDWHLSLATNGASGTDVSNKTGGALGSAGTQVQTITFSSAISSPVLFVNLTDATASLDFGLLTPTLVDSNNAQLVANTITFSGSTNSFDDGFAAIIPGTFGPGNPLQFTMTTTGTYDSVGFTVAHQVPEPSALTLIGCGTIGLVLLRMKRQRAS